MNEELWNEIISQNVGKAKEALKGGRFYGESVNVENLEEVVAILYTLWKLEKSRTPMYVREGFLTNV